MKEKDVYTELNSIRSLMERSSKFISLSGLAGVLAGLYAIAGAFLAYRLVYSGHSGMRTSDYTAGPLTWWPLFLIALAVLLLSLISGVLLSIRKARKRGENFWTPGSRLFLTNLAIPLLTGGAFIVILILRGEYQIIAPSCLIFYGLSLVAGSHYTLSDVKWLGYCEILLGLLSALMPGYGLIFWVVGFGVLHIIYGSVMHFKYDG